MKNKKNQNNEELKILKEFSLQSSQTLIQSTLMQVTHSSTFCLSQNVEQCTMPCWMLNLFNESTDRLHSVQEVATYA